MKSTLMPTIGVLLALNAAAVTPTTPCGSIQGHRIAAAQIGLPTGGAVVTGATLTPAAGPLPEYCDVTGSIAPVDPKAPPINFRVIVPTDWNQKTWHLGGGGNNGVIPFNASSNLRGEPPTATPPVAQGFALYGSDSGHQNAPGRGPQPPSASEWIVNEEAWNNFAYEQLKKTHDAALQVLTMLYGVHPQESFFSGTSQGGREGLEAVTRYPQDYDGVYVTVPLAYFGQLLFDPTVKGIAQLAPGAWVPPAKAKAIRDETLRICDALDGVTDGVIANYKACNEKLDPAITPDPRAHIRCAGGADTGNDCLSDAQMVTVNSFHASVKFGYKLPNGESDWPGWGAGLEAGMWLLSNSRPDINNPGAFNAGLGASVQKGRFGGDQNFNLLTLDLVKFRPQIEALSDKLDVREDWSAWLKKGGKLIMMTAASDYISNPRAQMRLYEKVAARNTRSAMENSVRYYVVPNAGHGMTGAAADGTQLPSYFDPEAMLVDWVEKGVVPGDSVVLSEPGGRTRLICRYPQTAHYKGSGDAHDAKSFACQAR